ncbi:Copia protein [Senna tora]|uniref:Copia protein n=1 Tax=Senna tora TaxID=362788 RepID=A0A835CAB2_9FABA|nr:Copia protein [Senna tora]
MDLSHKVEERNRVLAKCREEHEKAKVIRVIQSSHTQWAPTKPNSGKTPAQTELSSKLNTTTQPNRGTESKRTEEKNTSSSIASIGRSKVRRLTPEEVAEKHRLGECFTCDEKYSPANKCKNKQLNILIMSSPVEDGEDEILLEEFYAKGEREDAHSGDGALMALSMNSIAGLTGGRTMKGTEIEQKFYPFDLGGVDMILCITWLESLGEVKVNWRLLTMKYRVGEALVCLKRDASLAKTEVSYRSVLKSIRKGGQGFMLELSKMESQTEVKSETQEVFGEVQVLLDEFKEVYEPLKILPPRRARDHAILVKEVLMQNKIPIAYFSQLLSNRAQKSSVYERELMAIVFARIIDPDQQKWVSKLMGYNFKIQYKPGVENKAVDALSRRHEPLELKAFSVWRGDEFDEWVKEVQNDEQLTKIKQQLISGEKPPAGYALQNGFLVYHGRLVIPKGSPWVARSKPVATPLVHNEKFSKIKKGNDVGPSYYRSLVGILLYLTSSRPDFMYAAGVLSRLSKKQEVVAQSTYIATAAAANQAIWLRKMLNDLHQTQEEATVIRVDNQSAIAMAKNPVHHGHTKHINVKFHAVRQAAKEGSVELVYCKSEEQLADIMTKSVSKGRFEFMRIQLGVLKKNLKGGMLMY